MASRSFMEFSPIEPLDEVAVDFSGCLKFLFAVGKFRADGDELLFELRDAVLESMVHDQMRLWRGPGWRG